MSNDLAPAPLSILRKKIGQLVRRLDYLSSRCLFADPLIRGTPGEVYRTCGKQGCKCLRGGTQRHGPYKVISVTHEGKQRQIALRRGQEDVWKLAQHYQYQVEQWEEVRKTASELTNLIWSVIERRLRKFPE